MVRSPSPTKIGEYTEAWIHKIATAPAARAQSIRQTQPVKHIPQLSIPVVVARSQLEYNMVVPQHWPILTQALYTEKNFAVTLPPLTGMSPPEAFAAVRSQIPEVPGVWISRPPSILTYKIEADSQREAQSPIHRKIALLIYDTGGHFGCYIFDDLAKLSVPLQTEFCRAPSFRIISDNSSWQMAPPLSSEYMPTPCTIVEPSFGGSNASIWRVNEGASIFGSHFATTSLAPVVAGLASLALGQLAVPEHLPPELYEPCPVARPSFHHLEHILKVAVDGMAQHPNCRFDLLTARGAIIDRQAWLQNFTGPPPTVGQFAALFKARRQKIEISQEKPGLSQPLSQLDVLVFVVPALSPTAAYTTFTVPLTQHEIAAAVAGGA
jgi:hypothetical protein